MSPLRTPAPALVPAYEDRWLTVLAGDCRAVLPSPPYWQQRSYLPDGHELKALEIGLEATFVEWVAAIADLCDEFARVLKPTGSLWINVADRYCIHGGRRAGGGRRGETAGLVSQRPRAGAYPDGVRPKSLVLGPYRLAIALEDRGWIVRDRIVWWKTNGMGESVHDRFHVRDEVLFRLTRERFAYFDEEAIKVPLSPSSLARRGRSAPTYAGPKAIANGRTPRPSTWRNHGALGPTANPGNVWRVATANAEGRQFAHTAMFPAALIRRPILATCPPGGVVLDPFAGTGTTAQVANDLMRRAVLIELDPASIDAIRIRTAKRPIIDVPA